MSGSSSFTHLAFNNAPNLPKPNTMWVIAGAMKICKEQLVACSMGNTMGKVDMHLHVCKVKYYSLDCSDDLINHIHSRSAPRLLILGL